MPIDNNGHRRHQQAGRAVFTAFPTKSGRMPSRPCSRLPGVAIRATMLKEIQVHLGNVGSNYLTTDRNLI